MESRVFGLFAIAFFLLFSLNSCKEDTNGASLEDTLCSPTSDHYFRGIVGNAHECWNNGENNYQVYHGWSRETDSVGITSQYWQPGLDQWPVPDDNKTIYLYIEVPYEINECTSEEFHNTFQTGSYAFSPINSGSTAGIVLYYRENGEYFNTAYGPQDGSYLECTGVTNAEIYGHHDALNLTWEFKCKLYRPDETFYKELKIGEMRVSVLRNEG